MGHARRPRILYLGSRTPGTIFTKGVGCHRTTIIEKYYQTPEGSTVSPNRKGHCINVSNRFGSKVDSHFIPLWDLSLDSGVLLESLHGILDVSAFSDLQ